MLQILRFISANNLLRLERTAVISTLLIVNVKVNDEKVLKMPLFTFAQSLSWICLDDDYCFDFGWDRRRQKCYLLLTFFGAMSSVAVNAPVAHVNISTHIEQFNQYSDRTKYI